MPTGGIMISGIFGMLRLEVNEEGLPKIVQLLAKIVVLSLQSMDLLLVDHLLG